MTASPAFGAMRSITVRLALRFSATAKAEDAGLQKPVALRVYDFEVAECVPLAGRQQCL
jgi:hypothetical protein